MAAFEMYRGQHLVTWVPEGQESYHLCEEISAPDVSHHPSSGKTIPMFSSARLSILT